MLGLNVKMRANQAQPSEDHGPALLISPSVIERPVSTHDSKVFFMYSFFPQLSGPFITNKKNKKIREHNSLAWRGYICITREKVSAAHCHTTQRSEQIIIRDTDKREWPLRRDAETESISRMPMHLFTKREAYFVAEKATPRSEDPFVCIRLYSSVCYLFIWAHSNSVIPGPILRSMRQVLNGGVIYVKTQLLAPWEFAGMEKENYLSI